MNSRPVTHHSFAGDGLAYEERQWYTCRMYGRADGYTRGEGQCTYPDLDLTYTRVASHPSYDPPEYREGNGGLDKCGLSRHDIYMFL